MGILLYITAYLLSFFGYLLGSATKEEHKEIKPFVFALNGILRFSFYAILALALLKDVVLLVFIMLLFLLHIFAEYFKKNNVLKYHDIIILATSIIFLSLYNPIFLPFVLLFVFVLLIENSFVEFKIYNEFLYFTSYLFIYFTFYILQF